MRFLLSWLKEFIELSLHPSAIAERLTMGGVEVTGLTQIEGDWLFELEVTPNRPDLLSHLGIARETAALLGRPFRFPRWLQRQMLPLEGGPQPPSLQITLQDPEGCRRYCGLILEGVTVKAGPPRLTERLSRLGVRPINNVVDVTNLCMLEVGQPLHAFDLDKLEGSAIQVRRARPGETLVTIDGVSHPLTPEMLVIADGRRPIALAGVMGGRETEITPATRRILLESAWFDPIRIRRSSRLSRLGSESSYRFERGVDPAGVPAAAIRSARWIADLSGGNISGGLIDVGGSETPKVRIPLRPQRAAEVLGMPVTLSQQRRFLEQLGCRVAGTATLWQVEPPSWREDLRIPEDLYEELVRLWGYERCAPTLPPVARTAVVLEGRPPEDPWMKRQRQIRQWLVAAGMQEIMTHSLLSPEDLARGGSPFTKGAISLENPLSVDQGVLRNTLLVGALQTVARNLNRKATEGFELFEMGRIFSEDPGRRPKETSALALLVAGERAPAWGLRPAPLGLFHLKGILEMLLQRLRVESVMEAGSVSGGFLDPGIRLKLGKEPLGVLGWVDPKVLAAYEIPPEPAVAYAQIDLDLIRQAVTPPVRMQALPKVPPVVRDLAILVHEAATHREIVQAIEEAGAPLLKSAALFDLYKGKQVPSGKKSMAFRLSYSAGDRTLTEEEISATHQRIVGALQAAFQAVLR
ncbi:MAG: phenylalanine--tRNA ligase subunit beta [Candidatus Omnitrophica bacterium]|nr:phenylalanine--tRNA ligase subunit beta [Candidatus Omnitrophota bacterium]